MLPLLNGRGRKDQNVMKEDVQPITFEINLHQRQILN